MTGAGMMDCKKALVESDGDMDKAMDFLREQGLAKQAKKASRVAAEGVAFATTTADGKAGVVVEVNAETDFVAKNADFMAFVETVANTILEGNPADVEALAALKAVGTDMTVEELLREKVLVIGENIKIRRFVRFEATAFLTFIWAARSAFSLTSTQTLPTRLSSLPAVRTLLCRSPLWVPSISTVTTFPLRSLSTRRRS
jgi:translation elongation factor Ts